MSAQIPELSEFMALLEAIGKILSNRSWTDSLLYDYTVIKLAKGWRRHEFTNVLPLSKQKVLGVFKKKYEVGYYETLY